VISTRRLTPYLYLAPMLALLLIVFGYPLVSIFNFSLRRIRGATGPFIGLENYRQVFKDEVFWQAVMHNALLLLSVPILIVVSILVAVVLYERVAGWKVYRSLLFVPYVTAVPIAGVVFGNMFQLNGAVNEVLRAVGLDFLALDWLGSERLALWTVMVAIIWHEVAFGIVLFLARMLSLDQQIQEAAQVDGAGWWQRLWYVTIPQLRTIIEFYTVITVITILAWVFSYVYVITRGGPGTSTQILELYIYNFAFRNGLPGIASAVAVILFVVTLLLIIPLFWIRDQTRLAEDTA
jgi:ABC-type sugar transport system permease subunit